MEKLIKPKMVTLISRRLKSGVKFKEYHEKWMPQGNDCSEYFSFPVQVIHLENVNDPDEIISIGLLDADESVLYQEAQRICVSEKERSDKISKVCDKVTDTKLYRVVTVDTLGK